MCYFNQSGDSRGTENPVCDLVVQLLFANIIGIFGCMAKMCVSSKEFTVLQYILFATPIITILYSLQVCTFKNYQIAAVAAGGFLGLLVFYI